MEETRKFKFNLMKSKYMIIKTGKKKKGTEEPKIELRSGTMEEANEYSYLGNMISSQGRIGRQLDEVEKKANAMVVNIERIGSESKLGKLSSAARILMYEKTATSTLLFNLECWNGLTDTEWMRLERVQGKMLKRLMRMPNSTPYWGMLKELGMWTARMKVVYQKLMLYKTLMDSEEGRTARKIIEEQEEEDKEYGFYREISDEGKRIGVNIREGRTKTKAQWKKDIKNRIDEWMDREWLMKRTEMKKLRHVTGKFERKSKGYIERMGVKDVARIMRTRLEMWDIGRNLGGQERKCKGCNKETEKTEHIIKCKETRENIVIVVKDEWINGTDKQMERVTRYLEAYMTMMEKNGRSEGENKEESQKVQQVNETGEPWTSGATAQNLN